MIGLAAMVNDPLIRAEGQREKKISFNQQDSAIFVLVFNKTIIPLALVGYEMIVAHSALRASLTVYHIKFSASDIAFLAL